MATASQLLQLLAFLTARALEDRRKEEQEEREKEAMTKKEAEKLEEERVAEQLEQGHPDGWVLYTAPHAHLWHRLSKSVRLTLPSGASCGQGLTASPGRNTKTGRRAPSTNPRADRGQGG